MIIHETINNNILTLQYTQYTKTKANAIINKQINKLIDNQLCLKCTRMNKKHSQFKKQIEFKKFINFRNKQLHLTHK